MEAAQAPQADEVLFDFKDAKRQGWFCAIS